MGMSCVGLATDKNVIYIPPSKDSTIPNQVMSPGLNERCIVPCVSDLQPCYSELVYAVMSWMVQAFRWHVARYRGNPAQINDIPEQRNGLKAWSSLTIEVVKLIS